jgi:hypothetical protein
MTGYDSSGGAVRGLLLAFTSAQLPTQMMIQVLDGTARAQIFSLTLGGTASVQGAFTHSEGQFVGRALRDLADHEGGQGETSGSMGMAPAASGGLHPQDVPSGLHALNQPGPTCDPEYGSDLHTIAEGGLLCAVTAPLEGAWAIAATGATVALQHYAGVPGCLQAAQSFFALGTHCSTSCFQNQDACPSCGAGTHLAIDDATGVGTCVAGDTPVAGGCPAGSTWVPGPNNKGHTCCLVCGGSSAASGGSVTPASLRPQDLTDPQGGCPLESDGVDGGQGEGGGYAFVERAHDRHHVYSLNEGASETLRFTWNDVAGVAPPADLWVEARETTVLQVSSVANQPFARSGLNVVRLVSGQPYRLVLERTHDDLHVTLRSDDDVVVLSAAVPSNHDRASNPQAIDVVLPSLLRRASIESNM